MTAEQFLGYWSGLAFVVPGLDWPVLLGTSVAVNLCNAFMCRVMAGASGYSRPLWFALGLTAGVWAVAVVSLLPRRVSPPPPTAPPGRLP